MRHPVQGTGLGILIDSNVSKLNLGATEEINHDRIAYDRWKLSQRLR